MDGMRFAICNEMFGDRPFEKVCAAVANAGYEGLELAPFTLAPTVHDLTAAERERLRRIAGEHGLEIIGLHWLLAKTTGFHLTSPDDATRTRTADYLVALGEACRDLGGTVMVFGSPPQRSLPDGVGPEQGMTHAADVFRRAMPAIADAGVRLCIEPLAPVETDFVTTCAEGRRLVDLVDHPSFCIHLDVKAMSSEPTPLPDLIREHAPAAGHFHANDRNLRGPGFGDTDFVPVFAALRDADYRGWVSVEVFDYTPDPDTIARDSLSYMRSCLRRVT